MLQRTLRTKQARPKEKKSKSEHISNTSKDFREKIVFCTDLEDLRYESSVD